ncbi:hypothetical protein CLAFUW4_07706 [Fulvia fulva]|uniref:Anaphase-promoting complex, subunit CDC26 n=1 Tax=Passalora fulva TaxID=5499 RepID=A0A9Q8LD47_PASFU|nr:uncharacterized protein CLAFUR5_07834 [Fulvia fulva]KAK4629093.1 hypothetical protein CLAFUR4_07711 [Fulvia fulva]KAK4630143.1 hypothetical protein CLAFUR0_07709 [Fulvia fulva]UJO15175.1 hypothetical protein CLAFUR5_07834 [Fulvia fulva]WPV13093.1 hypothetical protein CLAFUW4_07706 [Fulvia fulva]WPV27267.1 hypothetical protein CLAFUW7_07707 [Fulvia fulva]
MGEVASTPKWARESHGPAPQPTPINTPSSSPNKAASLSSSPPCRHHIAATMLSRPATKISLTPDDITAYEERQKQRENARARSEELRDSGDSSRVEEAAMTPAEKAGAAKATMTREQRLGLGQGRS